jgi:hypothetical protein
MDSFGIIGTVPGLYSTEVSVVKSGNKAGIESQPMVIRIVNGTKVVVSHSGAFRLIIMTPTGRTLAAWDGKETATFTLNEKKLGRGLYIAVVQTGNGMFSQRFTVLPFLSTSTRKTD